MAIAEPTAPKPGADAGTRLILQFVRSVKEVLGTMAGIPVQVGTPRRCKGHSAQFDVSGVVGFSGEFVGSMVLSFPLPTARAVVLGFAGSEIDAESPDFSDAIGELANMIVGDTRASLGDGTLITVPNIVIGNGHTISGHHDIACLALPCQTKAGEFTVLINIKPSTAAPAGGRP